MNKTIEKIKCIWGGDSIEWGTDEEVKDFTTVAGLERQIATLTDGVGVIFAAVRKNGRMIIDTFAVEND